MTNVGQASGAVESRECSNWGRLQCKNADRQVAAIFILYAALSYYGDSAPDASGLATGLSLAPILLIGTGSRLALDLRPLVAISILVVIGGLLYHYWSFLKGNYQWSNLAQQAGAYALVALSFARSLFRRSYSCARLLKAVLALS